MSKGLKIMLF